jgi:hypothetical protein
MGGRFGTLSEFRRRVAVATLALLTLTGFLALVPGTASAAATWFVAPAPTGANTTTCGTTATTPCATVSYTAAKAAFASGDTIMIAAGTYTDHPAFGPNAGFVNKSAILKGAGAASTIFDGANASFGIGSTLAAPSSLSLSDLTVTRGRNTNGLGGGVAVLGTGPVALTNVNLTGNSTTATGGGAGLYVQGAPVTVTGGTISGNTGAFGGAAFVTGANSTITFNGTTISGNGAANGGGLYITTGGSVTMNGGSLSTNTATASVASTGVGGGAFVAANATLALHGVTVNGNSALASATANTGVGGAVSSAGSLTISDLAGTPTSFSGNKTTASPGGGITGWGGAILSTGPTLSISNTTITGGLPSGQSNAVFGGAIVSSTPGATLSNVTLDGNSALVAGGLWLTGSTTITNSTIEQGSATNAGLGFGGGILAQPNGSTPATITLTGTDVTDNSAAVLGGGIALLKGVTLNVGGGSHIDGNTAPSGAGIASSGAVSVNGSSVSNNDASLLGGGIYSASSTSGDTPTLTLTNATIDGNTAALGGGGLVVGGDAGGTSPNMPSTVTATGGEINGNSSGGGGGVVIGETGTATFDGTTINGNSAPDSLGGGILSAGSTTLRRATLDGNTSVAGSRGLGIGGAIYSGSNHDDVTTKLVIDSSTISNNDAAAAAAVSAGSGGDGDTNLVSIDNSTITGNTNDSSVVAESIVQAAGTVLTISRSTITGNTNTSSGTASVSGALGLADGPHASVSGTILSGNTHGGCTGTPVDGGYNLADSGDTSCGFSAAKHDVAAAPQLGALASNGGPTKTQLPGPASPVLDKIPSPTATGVNDAVSGNPVSLCASGSKDQRGTDRPQGTKCDIGAVEVGQTIPVITVTAPAPGGQTGITYSAGMMGTPVVFTATGSPLATFSKTGTLPSGVQLVDNGDGTATLSGTPSSTSGGDYPITVKATNEAGTGTYAFDLKVNQAPTIGGPASDTYTVGQADGLAGPDVFGTASGFPDAVLSTTSTLPSGVTFSYDSDTHKATISGTPAAGTGGVYTIVIKGTNGTSPDASFTFTLTVQEAPGVTGPASGTATVGHAFTSAPPKFTTTGFPVSTLSATNLPSGLSLQDNHDGTAQIAGTPAAGTGGTYDVVVTATNGVGSAATTHYALTVNAAPTIVGPASARAVVGFASHFSWQANGFPAAITTTIGGDPLPSGLSFSQDGTGGAHIDGTPAAGTEGTYDITLTASNGIAPAALLHVALEVAPKLGISTTALPAGSIGSFYSAPVIAVGGEPPYAFTLDGGQLPSGLHLGSDGVISGTPTGPTTTATFTVRVSDSASPDQQTATKTLSITVGKGATNLDVSPVLIDAVNLLGIKVNLGFVEATLTGGSPAAPIAGQTIVWKAGGATVCTGTTDSSGHAQCAMTLDNTLRAILNLGVTASYAGNGTWQAASGSAGIIRL